jgi:hypothetical protein
MASTGTCPFSARLRMARGCTAGRTVPEPSFNSRLSQKGCALTFPRSSGLIRGGVQPCNVHRTAQNTEAFCKAAVKQPGLLQSRPLDAERGGARWQPSLPPIVLSLTRFAILGDRQKRLFYANAALPTSPPNIVLQGPDKKHGN